VSSSKKPQLNFDLHLGVRHQAGLFRSDCGAGSQTYEYVRVVKRVLIPINFSHRRNTLSNQLRKTKYSWEANTFSANQKIPNLVRNPNIYYSLNKRPPLDPILGQINPINTRTHFFTVSPNIVYVCIYFTRQKYCHMYQCDSRRGFGLDIGFINHLYTKLVTTLNCIPVANFHSLQIAIARSKSFSARSVFTSRCLVTASNNCSFRIQFLSDWWLPSNSQILKVKVNLRLTVYCQSVRLGVRPLETHDQSFFLQLNSCGNSPYVTSSPEFFKSKSKLHCDWRSVNQ
jgi:hypothetical protein